MLSGSAGAQLEDYHREHDARRPGSTGRYRRGLAARFVFSAVIELLLCEHVVVEANLVGYQISGLRFCRWSRGRDGLMVAAMDASVPPGWDGLVCAETGGISGAR
jgi:hypothetical protein